MRTTWAMCAALALFFGCGQGSTDGGADPKARTNEVGPIERELRRTTGADDEDAPRGPTATREGASEPVAASSRRGRRPAEAPSRPGGDARRAARSTSPSRSEGVDFRSYEPPRAPRSPREADNSWRSWRLGGGDRAIEARTKARTTPSSRERAGGRAAQGRASPDPITTAAHPERQPAAEPGSASAAPAPVELIRLVVARAVEQREPVGAPPFAPDVDRAFLFVEASNDGAAAATLAVEWIAPDGTRGRPIELSVPPTPRWRTWATTSRVGQRPGRWTAVVRHDGRELSRTTFEVSSGEVAGLPVSATSAGG